MRRGLRVALFAALAAACQEAIETTKGTA